MGRTKQVLQLDFETGEVIDTYASIEEAAYDNWLTHGALSVALRKYNGYLTKKELRFKLV